jgi:hypothetical protein
MFILRKSVAREITPALSKRVSASIGRRKLDDRSPVARGQQATAFRLERFFFTLDYTQKVIGACYSA